MTPNFQINDRFARGGRSSKTDRGEKTLYNIDAFTVSCMNERVILRHEKHSVFSNVEICPEMHVIAKWPV